MPIFYFDVQDGVFTRDDHGMECRDIGHARKRAKHLLPEIALDELPQLDVDEIRFIVTVRDDTDAMVYRAHLDFKGTLVESGVALDMDEQGREAGDQVSDELVPFALVADDDVLIRMDAVDILEDAGFRVYEAGNVEEALTILEVSWESIQLLFTDVQMPPGSHNGFDLARQCAKSWPHIGILVSSGNMRPEPGDMPEGSIFVGKPFSHDVVYERLQELLPDGKQPEKLKKVAKKT